MPTRTSVARAVATSWADRASWDAEYGQLRSIPSSHRLRPSQAFRRLAGALALPPGARVLDAGCGTGRHALHLAAEGCVVDAVDTSGVACAVLGQRLAARPALSGAVHVQQAVLDPWSVPDATYDLIVDSYVSCHLLVEAERLRYLDALLGRLRPGGLLYTACMGADDAYYRPLAGGDAPAAVATDPLNGITKLLQPGGAFTAGLAVLAPVVAATAESFTDVVDGLPYRREVLAAVLRRP